MKCLHFFSYVTYIKCTCYAGVVHDLALLTSANRKNIWHIGMELVMEIMKSKLNSKYYQVPAMYQA